jgi:hypothetical protein
MMPSQFELVVASPEEEQDNQTEEQRQETVSLLKSTMRDMYSDSDIKAMREHPVLDSVYTQRHVCIGRK